MLHVQMHSFPAFMKPSAGLHRNMGLTGKFRGVFLQVDKKLLILKEESGSKHCLATLRFHCPFLVTFSLNEEGLKDRF